MSYPPLTLIACSAIATAVLFSQFVSTLLRTAKLNCRSIWIVSLEVLHTVFVFVWLVESLKRIQNKWKCRVNYFYEFDYSLFSIQSNNINNSIRKATQKQLTLKNRACSIIVRRWIVIRMRRYCFHNMESRDQIRNENLVTICLNRQANHHHRETATTLCRLVFVFVRRRIGDRRSKKQKQDSILTWTVSHDIFYRV